MENSRGINRLRGDLTLPNSQAEVNRFSSYIANHVLPNFERMLACPLKDVKMQGGVRYTLFENTEATWRIVSLNANRAMQIHCEQYGIEFDIAYRSDNYALANVVSLLRSCTNGHGCHETLRKCIRNNTRNPIYTLLQKSNPLDSSEKQILQQTFAYDSHFDLIQRFEVHVYNSNIAILADAYEELIQPKSLPLWMINWN
jgi:hypothetical protein